MLVHINVAYNSILFESSVDSLTFTFFWWNCFLFPFSLMGCFNRQTLHCLSLSCTLTVSPWAVSTGSLFLLRASIICWHKWIWQLAESSVVPIWHYYPKLWTSCQWIALTASCWLTSYMWSLQFAAKKLCTDGV